MPKPGRIDIDDVDELNAAFDAVYPRILALTDLVPWPLHDKAREKLLSPEGKRQVVDMVDAALDAAEIVREQKAAKT